MLDSIRDLLLLPRDFVAVKLQLAKQNKCLFNGQENAWTNQDRFSSETKFLSWPHQ